MNLMTKIKIGVFVAKNTVVDAAHKTYGTSSVVAGALLDSVKSGALETARTYKRHFNKDNSNT